MVAASTIWGVQLTGRTRLRTSFFGKQILQVEVQGTARSMDERPEKAVPVGRGKWRDATFDDVYELKLREMDLLTMRGPA